MGPLPAISCRSLERTIGSYTKNIKATRNNAAYISNLVETTTLMNHIRSATDMKKRKMLPTGLVDLDAGVEWRGKIASCMNRSSTLVLNLDACTVQGAKKFGSFGVERDLQGDTRQNYMVKLCLNNKLFFGAIQKFLTVTAPSGENHLFVSVKIMKNLFSGVMFPYWSPVFSYYDDHVVFPMDAVTEHV
ncbi:hypothetical protein, partial, partial [Absidia glauca]